MRAVLPCLSLIAGALAGCALMPGLQDRHNPMAIYDAYLIAHGMALCYDSQPNADPAVTIELAKLDMRARRALVDLARAPNGDPDETARAVAALSDYAARQTNLPH
jgi:hypothetical protein